MVDDGGRERLDALVHCLRLGRGFIVGPHGVLGRILEVGTAVGLMRRGSLILEATRDLHSQR